MVGYLAMFQSLALGQSQQVARAMKTTLQEMRLDR
jgi:hypothetical protein